MRTSGLYLVAMHLYLTEEETAALTQGLHDIVESDCYPFSPRIRTEGDPSEAPAGAVARALAAAEALRAPVKR
jgi:hypothetical protein